MMRFFIAIVSLCFAQFGHAAYATLPAPAGLAGSPGALTYAAGAGDSVFGQLLHKPSTLGRDPTFSDLLKKPSTLSTTVRLSAAAPRVAAAVIYANPYVRVGVGIATWLGASKLVYDLATGTWHETKDSNEINRYYKTVQTGNQEFASFQSACSAGVAAIPTTNGWSYAVKTSTATQCIYTQTWSGTVFGEASLPITEHTRTSQGCPDGWTLGSDGCLSPQLTQPQMVELLNPANQPGWPMPSTVPKELPSGTPLPIENIPWINSEPGTNPQSRPIWLPTGDPVPNPAYDPNAAPSPANQPYYQPGVRVMPSPTVTEPLRIDIQPSNKPLPDPNPTGPDPDPDNSDNPTQPKPEDQQSLCEKHPDVLACERGDFDDTPLPPIPELYVRKYPDGLVGIWNEKKDLIKQSSMFTLADQLMPKNMTSGTCPAFEINLNFGTWANYGSHNVAPPCWIWPVLKSIIIVSALLLARALVFGG